MTKLLLDEPGSDEMERLAGDADSIAATALGYVELRAALAAARRTGRVTPAESMTLARDLERIWASIATVEVDTALLRRAADLADDAGLRATMRGFVHMMPCIWPHWLGSAIRTN